MTPRRACLELEDGARFEGRLFGRARPSDGEVVFNTGMVGYPESLTDPSYRGQILVLTYPLAGNYGVPGGGGRFESDRIQVRGLVVSSHVAEHSHWEARRSLGEWLDGEGVAGLEGIDTRELTKLLREKGTMLGRIVPEGEEPGPFRVEDPNRRDLVSEVTARGVARFEGPGPRVAVLDCGCKRSIVRELVARGCDVTVVPCGHDLSSVEADGVLLSNGPGDPALCRPAIEAAARLLARRPPVPVAGICLGCQLLALAAGGRTYKMRYGHRSQNQPVAEEGTSRCLVTSQNHGYAVDAGSLPAEWRVWYRNLNDSTVEGIRHRELPFAAVQFHPEASPGPTDSRGFFDDFVGMMRRG